MNHLDGHRAGLPHLPTIPKGLARAVRWAPWVIFGPITGFLLERAIASFRRGQWVVGTTYVTLNVAILLAIPLATAKLAAGL